MSQFMGKSSNPKCLCTNNRESKQKLTKLKEEIGKFTIVFGTSVPPLLATATYYTVNQQG